MNSYRFKHLNSCVRNELVLWEMNIPCIYPQILTDEQYKKYQKNLDAFTKVPMNAPIGLTISRDGDFWLVGDLDGNKVDGIYDKVTRFAPGISLDDALGFRHSLDENYVINADNTVTAESMIDFWKENQDDKSTIDLSKKTFVCPCCGKIVPIGRVHGAHVHKYKDTTLYITPTCDTCNTSKVKRFFKVKDIDLVKAPRIK